MVRIVLVRPRSPENLGAVARVMRNFGLEDWAIAALGTHDFAAARRVRESSRMSCGSCAVRSISSKVR